MIQQFKENGFVQEWEISWPSLQTMLWVRHAPRCCPGSVFQTESICYRLHLKELQQMCYSTLGGCFCSCLVQSCTQSEKRGEVASVIKWTVKGAVIEMCKQATEAGSQRESLCKSLTCKEGKSVFLFQAHWREGEFQTQKSSDEGGHKTPH